MDYGTVRIILEKATSSPANVELPELDEAIRWVEERATIRRLDRGTDRDVYSSQFEAAAVEMRVLRQLLAHGWFAGTVKSAHRVLTLLGREISLRGVENSREISLRGVENSREISLPGVENSREISLRGVENSREISLRGMESMTPTSQWERGGNNRQQTTARRPPILKLFFHYFLYWIAVVCCIVGLGSVVRRDSSAALN
jgi:hypothetical protein